MKVGPCTNVGRKVFVMGISLRQNKAGESFISSSAPLLKVPGKWKVSVGKRRFTSCLLCGLSVEAKLRLRSETKSSSLAFASHK